MKPISLMARRRGRERRSWLNERATGVDEEEDVDEGCDSSPQNSSLDGSLEDFPFTL